MSKQSERRRRVVRAFAPAVGLLAAGLLVWQGSYAAFSATSQTNTNLWTAGSLALQNNGGGTYGVTTTGAFGAGNMRPGDTGAACVTVKSTGTLSGNLHMYLSSLTDSTPSVGSAVTLTITAGVPSADVPSSCTGFPTTGTTTVYSGTLAAMPATYATSSGSNIAVAGGSVLEAYKVSWTFSSGADNTYMSKTATGGFTWEIQ